MFHTRQQFPAIQGLHLPGIGQPSVPSSMQSSVQSQSFHSQHLSSLNSTLGHSDTSLSIFDNGSGLQDAHGVGLVRLIKIFISTRQLLNYGQNTAYTQQGLAQTMTLSTATHEALMQSGNTAYMQLYTNCITIQAKYEALK